MSTKKEKCECILARHCGSKCSCPCHIQSESIEWEKAFEKNRPRGDEKMDNTGESESYYFGYKYTELANDENGTRNIHEVTDWGNIKSFISQAITTAVAKREESYREEVLDKLRNATCYSDPSRGVLISNPPQHRCDACGKLWYVGDKAPVCEYIRKADITNLKH